MSRRATENGAVSRARAAAGTIVFLVVAPGVVAGLVPRVLTGWNSSGPPVWLQAVGWIAVVAGAGVLLEAFARFVIEGIGTPAPVAGGEKPGGGGVHRSAPKPMYLAVAALILGQAAILGSWLLVAHAAAFLATVWSFVHWYEEPSLRRRFGAAYDEYASRVSGWWPRAPRAGKRP
jgi:protein-S-isoprenylcysteine O-methyltransferase Ste14